jgi:hypothetical protein
MVTYLQPGGCTLHSQVPAIQTFSEHPFLTKRVSAQPQPHGMKPKHLSKTHSNVETAETRRRKSPRLAAEKKLCAEFKFSHMRSRG